ncbi:ATP-binding protein [Hydromonas duriensis]|uniref:Phage DNA replication protein (Predicted replicative helicase loader) n=1 Tax=Hydromonas duriensis TaxID=1527608 RepID=A0A4R6Y2T9_9BURK|nr:ATP-binding protein [Hydromonas duriensis]TDR30664.1 phage DNA replication protein (predicted replicative helicase loader) [Hydromonas duriensis]
MDDFKPTAVPSQHQKLGEVHRVCPTHGAYVAGVYRWGEMSCKSCHEAALKAAERAEQQARHVLHMSQRSRHARNAAHIPERFADRLLSNYIPVCPAAQYALEVAERFVSEFGTVQTQGRSLIFCGHVGNGKTHLAIGIAHELIKKMRYPLFMSVLNAVRHVKETWRKDSVRSESQAIRDFIEPDLLILDEVGVQFGSDTEKLILFEIINGRYNRKKSTLLLSNLMVQELSSYLGEPVIDRLREGGGIAVPFTWASYRA